MCPVFDGTETAPSFGKSIVGEFSKKNARTIIAILCRNICLIQGCVNISEGRCLMGDFKGIYPQIRDELWIIARSGNSTVQEVIIRPILGCFSRYSACLILGEKQSDYIGIKSIQLSFRYRAWDNAFHSR